MGKYSKRNVDANIDRYIMSSRAIKLLTILSENLLEIGDLRNIQPYEYAKRGNDFYEFESEDESYVTVEFYRLSPKEVKDTKFAQIVNKSKIDSYYNLGYKVDGVGAQAKQSDVKELLKILKTVLIISNEFLSNNKKSAILIFEDNKNQSLGITKGQKTVLYRATIEQNIPPGMVSVPAYYKDTEGLIIGPK